MLNRIKLLLSITGLFLLTVGVNPALAKAKAAQPTPTGVQTSYAMEALGTSIDGYWATDTASWDWMYTNGCSFCTGDPSCNCFYSDSTGGSGLFQVNAINQYTTMVWTQELDYTTYSAILSGSPPDACYAASGEGQMEDIQGSTANSLQYSTTGLLCVTPDGQNQTYTGSYVITGGTGLYENYQGSGNIGHAIYGRLPSQVISQIQYTGNYVPPIPTPSSEPTPSPWTDVATPTP